MADLTMTQWRSWKTHLVPLLYDWFMNHELEWPSQACRWGPVIEDTPYMARQHIYLSEQTSPDHEWETPKLLVCEAEVLKTHAASSEAVASWVEQGPCPLINDVKVIVHPGEVNKIRELPQYPSIVITHTDAPQLYVWNTSTQPNMEWDKVEGWGKSTPEMTLVGHTDQAQFPLATARSRPMVASGGTDRQVLLWDLSDGCMAGGILEHKVQEEEGPSIEAAPERTTFLQPRTKLLGHTDTVEDVVFQPGSHTQLASVGDDKQILFWDTTSGNKPVCAIRSAHGSGPDVHCVDWSGLQEHLIVTGAADGSLKVWDRRALPASGGSGAAASQGCLHLFAFHRDAIMRVEWHATAQGVLASGGEDNLVAVWSLDRAGGGAGSGRSGRSTGVSVGGKEAPPELLFKHVGHKGGKVVDFQWCPFDPWLMMSISESQASGASDEEDEQQQLDEGEDSDGGGSEGMHLSGGMLQLWRISDMLYRPEEEALAELEEHREWILSGRAPESFDELLAELAAKREAEEEQGGEGGQGGVRGEEGTSGTTGVSDSGGATDQSDDDEGEEGDDQSEQQVQEQQRQQPLPTPPPKQQQQQPPPPPPSQPQQQQQQQQQPMQQLPGRAAAAGVRGLDLGADDMET